MISRGMFQGSLPVAQGSEDAQVGSWDSQRVWLESGRQEILHSNALKNQRTCITKLATIYQRWFRSTTYWYSPRAPNVRLLWLAPQIKKLYGWCRDSWPWNLWHCRRCGSTWTNVAYRLASFLQRREGNQEPPETIWNLSRLSTAHIQKAWDFAGRSPGLDCETTIDQFRPRDSCQPSKELRGSSCGDLPTVENRCHKAGRTLREGDPAKFPKNEGPGRNTAIQCYTMLYSIIVRHPSSGSPMQQECRKTESGILRKYNI